MIRFVIGDCYEKKISNILFIVVLTFLISISVTAATYLYNASEVSYNNTKSHLTSTDVQSAMSELYTKCNASTTNCPSGHTCTDKTNIKCKRATTLHTEECKNSETDYFCQGDGYELNDTITYGNETITEGVLTTGDAFDCDVNGDGIYDATAERFYYISDYFDTSNKSFNDSVAVLVYYKTTYPKLAAYDKSGKNNSGPVTLMTILPTTNEWSNIRLYKSIRQILTEISTIETVGGVLPTAFDYSDYSARLLTSQEIVHGCNYYGGYMGENSISKNCRFLFESTSYSLFDYTFPRFQYIETPVSSSNKLILSIHFDTDDLSVSSETNISDVRPAIEVLKSEILY